MGISPKFSSGDDFIVVKFFIKRVRYFVTRFLFVGYASFSWHHFLAKMESRHSA
jgi:hypothetical protein